MVTAEHLSEYALEATDLEIGYRNGRHTTVVASGINAALHCGAVTCLLGPNGAGKSTLLRTLSRQIPVLGGSVTVDGRNITDASLREVSRMMSCVYTGQTNVGALTASEVVALGRQPYTGFFGHLGRDDRAIVEESMEAMGITGLAGSYMATLSDGQRQKVMIARALAQRTPVMVLDEPTTFLDVASRLEVMELLSALSRDYGTAVLLSTHDVAAALTVASHLWLMDAGGRLTQGPADEMTGSGLMDTLFEGRNIAFDAAARDYRIVYDSRVTE